MRLIVRIKDKSAVKELKRFGEVSYVSELINVVGLGYQYERDIQNKRDGWSC